jgi:hypothetical protein
MQSKPSTPSTPRRPRTDLSGLRSGTQIAASWTHQDPTLARLYRQAIVKQEPWPWRLAFFLAAPADSLVAHFPALEQRLKLFFVRFGGPGLPR